ncbi:hypothetical protein [Carboxylicivirga sp. M1479]|uniref:hypothetical protein n=1 Tax=Carboxylicivirga sp. M1479 TaxID=2594476 RepID=UPI001177A2D9|nr:hypothetical protein [Carboxylicivirga sp. M1479]TRX70880.1 hypothetical protein FNN09_09460 [Carboxylicivirga sp. M1479]
MKKIASYGWFILVIALLVGACEGVNEEPNPDVSDLSLEEAVNGAALNIDAAVEDIEASYAYQLFATQARTKGGSEEDAPTANMYLEDIMGVYEYAPSDDDGGSKTQSKCESIFKRTGDSEWLVVYMPFEKLLQPKQLFEYDSESEIVNNLMINTTEYLYESSQKEKWMKYNLASNFMVDEEYAGHLWVQEEKQGFLNVKNSSKFGFTDEHFIKVMTQFNDTLLISYGLENANEEKLYCETISFVLSGLGQNANLQFAYEMQIGDVRIVKTLDEEVQLVYHIYKGDVLQENAMVEVIMPEGESATSYNCLFMHNNKDLKITFDDESEVLLSDLLGDSQDVLSGLFSTMKDMYLSKVIVNHLAWTIYAEQNCDDDEG